jgi:hypothetical protein
MRARSSFPPHWQGMKWLFIGAMAAAILLAACRSKDNNIVGPPPDGTGSWTISLDSSDTLYVPNDTIAVRLFDPTGAWASARALQLQATISVDSVSSQATTASDTLSHPWGTLTPVYYWGSGDAGGQEQPHEIIHAYYVDPQSHDTLAETSRFYYVAPRP